MSPQEWSLAAMLLSAAGVLRGRPCTTHRVARDALASEGGVLVDARVVDDVDVVTAGGVTSGISSRAGMVRPRHHTRRGGSSTSAPGACGVVLVELTPCDPHRARARDAQ